MEKMNLQFLKEKYIYVLGYLYLLLSIIIFLLGNIKYIVSIPLVILLFIAALKSIKNAPNMVTPLMKSKKILVIMLIISIWVIFSGIGGFVWQNYWDHKFRNAIFMDLVNHKWPIILNGYSLCYYIGFWLPASLVGKLFGLEAGYLFQVLWAILGILIAFGIMCQYLKKVKISNILILIFFSGLDVFLYLIFSKLSFKDVINSLLAGTHIELATQYFNSSSNTTLLFWLYNQIIPFWVGMMLLLQQENSKSIVFIFSLMLLFSPFPLVSLAPIIVYLVFKRTDSEKYTLKLNYFIEKIKNACTFENLISVFLALIIALFFKTNIAANKIHLLDFNTDTLFRFLCYIFFEYLIYLIFIYKKNYKDPILNILLITNLILPFVCLGNSYDFAWRTCIPLSFYIMLLIMKDLHDKDTQIFVKISLIILLCLGSITPLVEMKRTYYHEKLVIEGTIDNPRSDSLPSVFIKESNECYENFIGDTKSMFHKYFSK